MDYKFKLNATKERDMQVGFRRVYFKKDEDGTPSAYVTIEEERDITSRFGKANFSWAGGEPGTELYHNKIRELEEEARALTPTIAPQEEELPPQGEKPKKGGRPRKA